MPFDIPPDFFEQPGLKPDDYVAEPDLVAAADWLLQYVTPDDWQRRRMAALKRFLSATVGEVGGEAADGRLFDPKDKAGWYLFLLKGFIDHPTIYEYTFGARVIPLFQALGRDLALLKKVAGVGDRVTRMLGKEKAQVDAGLFELLVALAYCKVGATVSFRPERPGVAKEYDLDVEHEGVHWAIECKRMQTSEYAEKERSAVRRLWNPAATQLEVQDFDVICRFHFTREIDSIPPTYLAYQTGLWLRAGALLKRNWSDEYSIGSIERFDLRPMQAHLEEFDVNRHSAQYIQLLNGTYRRGVNVMASTKIQPADNPVYVDSISKAVVLEWQSLSEEAVDAKARDVMKRLSESVPQLPSERPSIVHIALESVEGDPVERKRFDKVRATLKKFDPNGKPLEYVYVHWFAPDCPPNQAFDFQETAKGTRIRAKSKPPLADGLLVTPPSEQSRKGPFWN